MLVYDLFYPTIMAGLLSLNPYSIGCWSMTMYVDPHYEWIESLNPYSIGCWSMTIRGNV